MIYLNIDESGYLLSAAKFCGGIETDIDLTAYDLTGDKIRAYKWENETLFFDADRYAEIEAENKAKSENPAPNISVYDELAAAYKEGVQEA